MHIINESRVDFQYKLGEKEPVIRKTIFSNRVLTEIIDDRLKVHKKVDKENACVFEILKYTVVISNKSSDTIKDVFFKDPIDNNIKFINGSIRINGVKKRCVNPNDGFKIGTIQKYSTLIIDFKVVVLSGSSLCNISNCSYITYNYTYNIELPPRKVTVVTNNVVTYIENRLFKQINVGNKLKISSGFSVPKNNPTVYAKINILKTKLVPTNMIKCSSDSKLDLCKIVIIGSIEYFLEYKSYGLKKSLKSVNIEGFSTFMLIPCGVQYCNDYKLEHKIENISILMLNEKTLFVDTEILLTL